MYKASHITQFKDLVTVQLSVIYIVQGKIRVSESIQACHSHLSSSIKQVDTRICAEEKGKRHTPAVKLGE